MPTIVCPNCGQQSYFETIERAAEEFCPNPRCDFPLFWARADRLQLAASNGDVVTRRRLPGTGGRLTIGHLLCPRCGELNGLTAKFCGRCGADLHPKAPPPPVVEVEVPASEPPAPPPPARRDYTPWIVLAFVVLAAVAAVLLSVL